MREYIERILHQSVNLDDYQEIKKLPLAYRNACRLYKMNIGGQDCILAAPRADMNLTELRKQQRMIERYTGYYCALYLVKSNYYAKDKMIEEGIPFVWEDHQIYLPFLGLLLNQHDGRAVKDCRQISFITQKLLLTALYDGWQDVTVTEAANRMSVSKMSVTRCFDEIQALRIPYLTTKNRARRFTADADKKRMWEQIRQFLRNPVIAEFKLNADIPEIYPFGGLSALAAYSLLGDEKYKTYAVPKKSISKLNISSKNIASIDEEPVCVVQEIGYLLNYGDGMEIDPLSVALSLSEAELNDPRVRASVEEMLEEYVW